jgi:hypothetical protein
VPRRLELEDIHMHVEHRLRELIGPAAGPAAYRAVPERSGRDRLQDVDPLGPGGGGCGRGRFPARAGRTRRGTCRERDARLHAPADRAAGHARPSPARLPRDVAAGSDALRGRGRAP